MENYFYVPGEAIKGHRMARKLTQERLAEIIGLSRIQVNGWESKKEVKIDGPMLNKLAKALEVNTNELTNVPRGTSKKANGDYMEIHREVWRELQNNNQVYKESMDKLIAILDRTIADLSKPGNRQN